MYSSLDSHFNTFQVVSGPEGLAQKNQMEAEIKKALDPASAGFQTPTAFGSAGQFSPLVAEDLDQLVSQIDFKAQHLAFFAWLPKAEAKQTVVQYVRWLSHGSVHIDHATVEGELSVANASAVERGKVEIKQYIETRSVTDVANAQLNTVGGAVVPSEPLATQTQEAMLSLHRGLERDCLFGNSAVAEAKIDGVIPQLITAGQYENLDGAQVTMELLEERVRDKQAAPYYGMPTDIFVTPKVYTGLTKQQIAMARREMNAEGITYGFKNGGLQIIVGETVLKVMPLIFLDDRAVRPVTVGMDNGTTVAPITYNQQPTAGAGTGFFGAADAGDYKYSIMAFNANGFSEFVESNAVTVAAGDTVELKIDNVAAHKYYKIFRTPVNTVMAGTALLRAKQYQYLTTIKKTAGVVTWVDDNSERTNAYKTLILRQDPAQICLYQLIKMMRIPLARTKAVQPFYLITAVGLALKVPEQNWLMTNCGAPA